MTENGTSGYVPSNAPQRKSLHEITSLLHSSSSSYDCELLIRHPLAEIQAYLCFQGQGQYSSWEAWKAIILLSSKILGLCRLPGSREWEGWAGRCMSRLPKSGSMCHSTQRPRPRLDCNWTENEIHQAQNPGPLWKRGSGQIHLLCSTCICACQTKQGGKFFNLGFKLVASYEQFLQGFEHLKCCFQSHGPHNLDWRILINPKIGSILIKTSCIFRKLQPRLTVIAEWIETFP